MISRWHKNFWLGPIAADRVVYINQVYFKIVAEELRLLDQPAPQKHAIVRRQTKEVACFCKVALLGEAHRFAREANIPIGDVQDPGLRSWLKPQRIILQCIRFGNACQAVQKLTFCNSKHSPGSGALTAKHLLPARLQPFFNDRKDSQSPPLGADLDADQFIHGRI